MLKILELHHQSQVVHRTWTSMNNASGHFASEAIAHAGVHAPAFLVG
jgi:hypothetical protein